MIKNKIVAPLYRCVASRNLQLLICSFLLPEYGADIHTKHIDGRVSTLIVRR
jgi:hypothetical protein